MALLAIWTIGCRHAPATPQATRPAPPPVPAGEILRVNESEGFVVVTAPFLPEQGQEATVFDQAGQVGRIRFTSPPQPPYMAADIVEGRPRPGDLFQVERPAAAKKRSTP